MSSTPLINGIAHSWGSIKMLIMGVPVVGITKLDYKDSQDIEPNMGAGNKPVSVGYGDVKYEGSLTLYAEEVEKLEELSPTGRLQDIPAFPIIVSYSTGGRIKTHRLNFCLFKENSRGAGSGDKKIEVQLPLFIGEINWK